MLLCCHGFHTLWAFDIAKASKKNHKFKCWKKNSKFTVGHLLFANYFSKCQLFSLSVNCFIAQINPSIANNVSTLKLNFHWLFGWEKEAKTDMKNSRVFHCIMRSGPLKFSWSWSLMQLLNGFVFSFSFEHWIKTFFTSKTNMQLVVLNLIFIKFHNFLCGSLSSECNEDIRCVCSLSSFVFNQQCYVFIVKTNDWRASYTECINLLGQPIKRHTFWRNSRCFYPAAQYHHIYYYSHL